MGGMLYITWSDPLEAIDFWQWWDSDSEGQFAAWYLRSKTLTWRQTRALMSSSLQLSLQSFLMRSVWETRLCWSCKSYNCQRKLNEGLQYWLSQQTKWPSRRQEQLLKVDRIKQSPGTQRLRGIWGRAAQEGRARAHSTPAAPSFAERSSHDNGTCCHWRCLQLSSPTTRQGVINRVWFHSPQIQTQWEKLVLRWKWYITRRLLNRKRWESFSTSQCSLTEIKTGGRKY